MSRAARIIGIAGGMIVALLGIAFLGIANDAPPVMIFLKLVSGAMGLVVFVLGGAMAYYSWADLRD